MDLIRNGKTPLLAAHRGVTGGNIPCNSEAAFRAAIAQGADIVELDVSLSRSGSYDGYGTKHRFTLVSVTS